MRVNYIPAINQNNPCDITGDIYITFLNKYTSIEELCKGERTATNLPYKIFEEIAADQDNYFINALQSSFIELSGEAKARLTNLINSLIEVGSTTDFQLVKSIIVKWEEDLLAHEGDFSKEDLASLFSASSIMRYGSLYWLEYFKENSGDESMARAPF